MSRIEWLIAVVIVAILGVFVCLSLPQSDAQRIEVYKYCKDNGMGVQQTYGGDVRCSLPNPIIIETKP